MGKLRIDMLGTKFTIQADNGNDEYLQKLLGYYKRITDDLLESGITNPMQVAILAGINLCDELYKEKENKIVKEVNEAHNNKLNEKTTSKENEAISKSIQDLMNKIDKVL